MSAPKGKRIAVVACIVGVIVILGLAFVFRDSMLGLWSERTREPLPRSPGHTGRVDIVQGSIRVSEFASFLESFTGLTVVVDSEVSDRPVIVASTIEDADGEVARALLESSGCVVRREELPNGREILRISAAEE